MEEYNPNYWEDEKSRIKQELDSEMDNIQKANNYLNQYRPFDIQIENMKSRSLDTISTNLITKTTKKYKDNAQT